jgi:hypothetical protein
MLRKFETRLAAKQLGKLAKTLNTLGPIESVEPDGKNAIMVSIAQYRAFTGSEEKKANKGTR